MKKPDEIKKGLEQYMSVDAYDCEISCKDSGCPYSGDERIGAETCGDLICADALAYIQQLEAELAAVKWQRDALLKTIDVEYIARLEEKAMRCDALEEMIKRGLCKENGGTEE